ncbi:sigma-70 family RNA polymerase sigma factor [bacterium]|nr:sigma-70 family RNA polymerase sigma factor [bacterium]
MKTGSTAKRKRKSVRVSATKKATGKQKVQRSDSKLSARAQEKMVLEYRIKARKLGRSILRKWHARLDLQEVDSVVDLSLCEAVRRFDPGKGAAFMTFLYYHLKGNLIRAVSAAAQANCIPTSAIDEEGSAEGATVTALEVVEAINGTEQPQPEELLLQKEMVHLSKDACSRLDPLEQQVIERLYLGGEQLMQIANSLGYSRCHISRVKKKALENLQFDLESTLQEKEEREGNGQLFGGRLRKPRKVQRRKGASRFSEAEQYSEAA